MTRLYEGGDTEKRLIRFVEPADARGTAMLTWDHDEADDQIWIYLPSLRKTRRIVSSEKASSFMGSEFTYADITPSSLDDFTHTLDCTESRGGVSCWRVTSVPKNDDIADENGYSKRVSWYDHEDFVVRASGSTTWRRAAHGAGGPRTPAG